MPGKSKSSLLRSGSAIWVSASWTGSLKADMDRAYDKALAAGKDEQAAIYEADKAAVRCLKAPARQRPRLCPAWRDRWMP